MTHLSQKTPITFKENFQIDIIDGLIHVYIPNAKYDVEKLKIAIDIIDNLSSKLELIQNKNTDDMISFSQEDINDLVDEYRTFGIQKLSIQETIKIMNKQLLDKLEELQLPKIKKILIKMGNIEKDNDFKCVHCNIWSGKNKASLSAHVKCCKSNPKNKEEEKEIVETKEENVDGENIKIAIPEKKKKPKK